MLLNRKHNQEAREVEVTERNGEAVQNEVEMTNQPVMNEEYAEELAPQNLQEQVEKMEQPTQQKKGKE
jgi:hypothetical protein